MCWTKLIERFCKIIGNNDALVFGPHISITVGPKYTVFDVWGTLIILYCTKYLGSRALTSPDHVTSLNMQNMNKIQYILLILI